MASTIYRKTEAGRIAFKQRGEMQQRERTAFILLDGLRRTDEVLRSTASMGVTSDDLRAMEGKGWIESAVTEAPTAPRPAPVTAPVTTPMIATVSAPLTAPLTAPMTALDVTLDAEPISSNPNSAPADVEKFAPISVANGLSATVDGDVPIDAPSPVHAVSAASGQAAAALDPRLSYQEAYPIAVALTSSLGLRGFRLNLAVETAGSHPQLVELLPKIRDAVGAEKVRPLERALGVAGDMRG